MDESSALTRREALDGAGWLALGAGRDAAKLKGGEPVLALDLYEHAYHMDYGAATKPYIDAFLANVAWDEVNRRVEARAAST